MEPGMMPFDMRSMTSASFQRPAGQYFATAPLTPGPMSTINAPAYQPAVSYASYAAYTPAPTPTLSPHFKQEPQPYQHNPERSHLRLVPDEPATQHHQPPQDFQEAHLSACGSRSPSVKSEAQTSITSTSSQRRNSRSIVSNFSSATGSAVDFYTGVDTLMKTIQAKPESETTVRNAEKPASPEAEIKQEKLSTNIKAEGTQTKERKVYFCAVPGCGKTFKQKTHLDIHRRAHTGDKPYMCSLPGCGARFSQLGNLKTHERRHTGEKPYKCPHPQCGKHFAQRGNVLSHVKTHNKTKPFECKLDNCNKCFTQLGNLKSHQNKFHLDSLKALTAKFASISDLSNLTKADKELWEYFAAMYKNSNKGIKGRGKHRKVGCITAYPTPQSSPVTPTSNMASQFPLPHGLPQLHTPAHHPLPFHGLSNPAAYSMSRPNMLVNININREPHTNYGLFEAVEDHGREFAYGDRMY